MALQEVNAMALCSASFEPRDLIREEGVPLFGWFLGGEALTICVTQSAELAVRRASFQLSMLFNVLVWFLSSQRF